MKAIKAITIGTSVLALIPAVLAAEKGLIEQGAETLFGAATGGGIFVKLGLFIILFSFLMLGTKKVFPAEHSKVGMLVAAILALIGMKFMPEMWVTGLGTLIWVAALALLPYAIVSIFIKEDVDKNGKISKKKMVFTLLAYAVLLIAVLQMKNLPTWTHSLGLHGEFWDDLSYRLGWVGQYWYVWIIAAVLVIFFIWMLMKKGSDSGSSGTTPAGDKVPGFFKKALKGLGKGIAAPFKALNKLGNKAADLAEKGFRGLGKGLGWAGRNGWKGAKGVGKGIGWAGKKFGRGVKKVAPGFANGVAKGAKGLGKGAKWLGGKAKNGVGGIRNKLARRKGRKAGEEFRAKELEYDAEQERIIEEKKRLEKEKIERERQRLIEREHEKISQRLAEKGIKELPAHATPKGVMEQAELKRRESAAEEKMWQEAERVSRIEIAELEAAERRKLTEREEAQIREKHEKLFREKAELKTREERVLLEREEAERIRLAEEKRGIGAKLLEALHLKERHMLPERATQPQEMGIEEWKRLTSYERDRMERERIISREKREKLELEEARARERMSLEEREAEYKRIAEKKAEQEAERERMTRETAEKAARHNEEMVREAKIKREAKEVEQIRRTEEGNRRKETERAERQRIGEEEKRKLSEEKARKAKLEAEREQMARQRREGETIRKREGRVLQNERKAAKRKR